MKPYHIPHKQSYYINDSNFKYFIASLMSQMKVVGPIEKKFHFSFEPLKKPDDLRLDYDVTVLPPKKEFFPPAQDLCSFDERGYEESLKVERKVLLGVHFYDIKGIDQTDVLFAKDNPDKNYLAHRQATTLIGSNIQKISSRAFWSTVGAEVQPLGHDGFLTHLESKGGYVYQTNSQKGEALLPFGSFVKANSEQEKEAEQINLNMWGKCPEELPWSTELIAQTMRKSFKNEALWKELAQDCFSCGSCNTVCPTCYCFDVQDHWNVDQKSGRRTRYWDSCLTEEFATISLGGGKSENFRDHRAQRKRHRFMRKTTYLNPVLGGPACVGCGRCSTACTADIADPVKVITRVMKEYGY